MTGGGSLGRLGLALVAVLSAAAMLAGGLALTGAFAGRVPSEARPEVSASPPTTVDSNLVDRRPAVGKESTLLPTAAAPTAARTRPAQVPTVTIPAIGVRATIVSEGIDTTPGDVGNLAIPWGADKVGWWDGGPAPGQSGVAVLAAHRVDDWAFWRVPQLRVGDAIRVLGTNGQVTSWKVSRIQQMLKAKLPSSIWAETGSPKLVLVTCGGVFDSSTGHYDDNVVVWANPA